MSRLYRSTRDKMITGLCGGLSESLGFNSTWMRLLVLISIPFSGGATFLIYIIAALVIPKESVPPFGPFNGPFGGGHQHRPGGPYDGGFNGANGASFYGNQAPGAGGYGGGLGSSFDPRQQHTGDRSFQQGFGTQNTKSDLDAMMEDIENKALRKELEELRQKLSKYENQKGDL
ncbi:PspC domain-containing protein [Paenibacillus sp. JX-17]|uniref:PspC domain-containing protein n=1 Tax=Paenibacillus lacisoli TaxID=3064525 RepID=A0ABT9CLT1_9BACL|nr:PspC domain-containing protein [Paenibacillus sp. JX-17]MDO7908877.1 PspC domain-containing protein [Paenibacillus sp. JX-17]